MTIASDYLAAIRAVDKLEDAIGDFIGDDIAWQHFGDQYDDSLEVFVAGLEPDRIAALGAFVLSLGFARTWIHSHAGRRDKCEGGPGKLCVHDRYFAAPRKESHP